MFWLQGSHINKQFVYLQYKIFVLGVHMTDNTNAKSEKIWDWTAAVGMIHVAKALEVLKKIIFHC